MCGKYLGGCKMVKIGLKISTILTISALVYSYVFASDTVLQRDESEMEKLEKRAREAQHNHLLQKRDYESLLKKMKPMLKEYSSNDNQLSDYKADVLLGKAKATRTYSSGDSYTNYLTFSHKEDGSVVGTDSSISYDSKYADPMACLDASKIGYDYICASISSLGENFTRWYVFDLNGNKIVGKFAIGTSTDFAYAITYGYAHDLYGTHYPKYTNSTSTTSSNYDNATSNTTDNCLPGGCSTSTTEAPPIPGSIEQTCDVSYGSVDDYFNTLPGSNSDLLYNHDTVEKIVQKVKEECKNDPESCGIKTYSTTVSNVSEVKNSLSNKKININGYFAKYGDNKYDWIFVTTDGKNIAKLEEGVDKDGNLRWTWISTSNKQGFDSVDIDLDNGFIYFGLPYDLNSLPGM